MTIQDISIDKECGHDYIRKTCLKIRLNLENILKIPCKILNSKRLEKPEEKPVIEDSIRGCL